MNKQKGFSAVIVLLIILVLGAVGFAGYYVYKQQGKNTTNNSTNVPTAQTEQKQPETPAPNLKDYITFNEMGVKAPKESLNSNIYYVYDSNIQYIEINSRALYEELNKMLENNPSDNTVSEELRSCEQGSAGVIYKKFKKDINVNEFTNQEYINNALAAGEAKDLGDYYLLYVQPQSACSYLQSQDKFVKESLSAVESAKKFFNSFTTL